MTKLVAIRESKLFPLYLVLAAALFLVIGWPTFPTQIFLFVAFVPLLFLESEVARRYKRFRGFKYFLWLYLVFVLWNFGATWWIVYANTAGMFVAVFLNSLFMPFPFLLYRVVKKNVDQKIAYIAFVCFWLAFEYLHLNWDLSWPWLNLGNAFAMWPSLIQWYEYTGILGGTLWVLLINTVVHYYIVEGVFTKSKNGISLGFLAFLIVFPTSYSLILKRYRTKYLKNTQPMEVVIVQPNIDPKVKFGSKYLDANLNKLIDLTEQKIMPNTKYIVWPETALQAKYMFEKNAIEEYVWPKLIGKKTSSNGKGYFGEYDHFSKVYAMLKRHPNLTLLTGVSAIEIYRDSTKTPSMVHEHPQLGKYASVNLSALLSLDTIQIYNKSKLVLGAEKIPYPIIFEPVVNALNIDEAANMGAQLEPEVFGDTSSNQVAAVICYESVYGKYLGQFVKKGASWIAVMTNDGWWENTDGHKQHYMFSVLRAIELRKPIVRSANTGISSFINTLGEEFQATKYWEPAAIRQNVYPDNTITFYAKHGDYIGRLATFLSFVLLFSGIIKKKTKK